MNIISSLFGRSKPVSESPWVEDSIYRLIESRIDESGKLDCDDLVLPDEEEVQEDGAVRWAAGAMDGVAGYHMGTGKEPTKAKRVARLIRDIARNGDRRAEAALVDSLGDEFILSIIDDVIAILAESRVPVDPHLHVLALNLCTHTRRRGAVKLGLALLGVLAITKHEPIVQTLGRHDEFTLYAAVALSNMLEDPSTSLWQLAQSVDGWGRIQVVERLVPTDDPEIQRWLRVEGFRNSVMYEYLAHTAAVHGRLCEALNQKAIETEELISASEIISALITGNGAPALGMDDYDDAAETCRYFCRHVQAAEPDIAYFLTSQLILDYMKSDQREASEKLKNGWTEAMRASVRESAEGFVSQAHWASLVRKALESEDPRAFCDADRAARYLGLDTFEHHWARLVEKPDDGGRWYNVMKGADAGRIEQIVALAEREIPLDDIATGPADEVGFGSEFASHSCLEFVLQDLGAFPGHGWTLVRAGLSSPVVRNRNMALNVLEAWGRDRWPPEAAEALAAASTSEPNDGVRERLEALTSETGPDS